MGAWIETELRTRTNGLIASHPTWVRGLKQDYQWVTIEWKKVAPYMGAWIETPPQVAGGGQPLSRTLHGCVD